MQAPAERVDHVLRSPVDLPRPITRVDESPVKDRVSDYKIDVIQNYLTQSMPPGTIIQVEQIYKE